MGPKQEAQPALLYGFSLEEHVPQDHLLQSIDRFVDLSRIRAHLLDFYSLQLPKTSANSPRCVLRRRKPAKPTFVAAAPTVGQSGTRNLSM